MATGDSPTSRISPEERARRQLRISVVMTMACALLTLLLLAFLALVFGSFFLNGLASAPPAELGSGARSPQTLIPFTIPVLGGALFLLAELILIAFPLICGFLLLAGATLVLRPVRPIDRPMGMLGMLAATLSLMLLFSPAGAVAAVWFQS